VILFLVWRDGGNYTPVLAAGHASRLVMVWNAFPEVRSAGNRRESAPLHLPSEDGESCSWLTASAATEWPVQKSKAPHIGSEHDPDWYQAEIVIRETLKGRSVVAIARCGASVRLHSSSHGRRLSAGDREMCFLWPLAILGASVTPSRSGSQFLLLNPQPLPTGARKLA
jgi:hypothetical protein